MRRFLLLCCVGILTSTPAFAESGGLAEAERAYQSVDFPATHAAAKKAIEAGGADREQTARLYVLLGISAAAQGDAEEAKTDFVVALAVKPSLKLDKGLSPKVRDPYLEAQGYWAAATPIRSWFALRRFTPIKAELRPRRRNAGAPTPCPSRWAWPASAQSPRASYSKSSARMPRKIGTARAASNRVKRAFNSAKTSTIAGRSTNISRSASTRRAAHC